MTQEAILAAAKTLFPQHARAEIYNLFDKNCPDEKIHHLASYAAMDTQLQRLPLVDWQRSGGFKRMYGQSQDLVRLVVQPTSNIKIIRMVLKEVCMYRYLNKFSIVPSVQALRVRKAGTLSQPIYECCYTMERMRGTLLEWLQERRSRSDILATMSAVIGCLKDMNSRGIKHNDAKLDNIMYTEHEGACSWYMIDLGLSTIDSAAGCDIWFFMWWMWYRARSSLKSAGLIDLCHDVLCVDRRRIQPDLLSRIKCKVQERGNVEYIDFTAPVAPQKQDNWVRAGIDKETLYKISQSLNGPHVAHNDIIDRLVA